MNTVNGKMYVGSAKDITRRWRKHRTELNCKKHHSQKLQRSWDKYGSGSFYFVTVEIVPDISKLVEREQWWMDLKDCVANGYNVLPTAGSCLGRRHTEETKLKQRAANLGKKRTEEAKRKMSEASKKKVITKETREKMASKLRGRPGKRHSDEVRKKMSLAKLGRKLSPEHCEKLSIAQKLRQEKLREERKVNENSPPP